MTKTTTRNHVSDLRGVSRLAIDATAGLTGLVQAMHQTIARAPGVLAAPALGPVSGVTGLVYGSINGIAGRVYESVRGVTRAVGSGIDAVLGHLAPMLGEGTPSPERDAVLAALNGVLGDYLAATGNPLAIPMRLRRNGQPLDLEHPLAAAIPQASGKLLLLVHGLCMNDVRWERLGHDHGAELARDLGYTPVYLHYNSGLHVSTNGRAFADLLEALVDRWPVPIDELVIVAHSMGGLLSRSACHHGAAAGHGWPSHLRTIVFLGTPHHGAPLERGGNWVDALLGVSPYTAPFARLGKIRSAGITDLRYGNLLDQDWAGRDRFELAKDRRRSVPLPEGVACYALAATTAAREGAGGRLPGDGLVPLDSALGRHARPALALSFPESRQWVGHGMNHFDLLSRPEVYAQLRRWLAGATEERSNPL